MVRFNRDSFLSLRLPDDEHIALHTAIQLAKLSGFHPIITTASPRNTALLTSLGATHVVDRRLPADVILEQLPGLAGGKPLEVVFDSVSDSNTQVLAYRAVPSGGQLVLVLPDVIPAELKGGGEQKRIVMVRGSISFPHTQAAGVELFKHLTEWLEKGLIKVSPPCLSLHIGTSDDEHSQMCSRSSPTDLREYLQVLSV